MEDPKKVEHMEAYTQTDSEGNKETVIHEKTELPEKTNVFFYNNGLPVFSFIVAGLVIFFIVRYIRNRH